MSSRISLDDAVLANLTDEERAAITGDEFSPEEIAALQGVAGGADATTEEEEDGADDGETDEVLDADGKPVVDDKAKTSEQADADAAAAAAASEAEAADATKGKASVAGEDVDTGAARVVYDAKLPENYTEKLADLKTQEDELRTKFKAGEIEFDDFESQRDALVAERDTLNRQATKAELLEDINKQNAASEDQRFEQTFIKSKQADKVDYTQEKNQKLFNTMLDEAIAENEGKSKQWLWEEAHKGVLRARGLTVVAAASGASAPVAAAKPATTSRKPPVEAAPKTLAQVPGGDGPGDMGSEFAHLDSLDGDDLESAIAKMTPAQREKYASGK